MATFHKHRVEVATFRETTVCEGPTSWADDGIPIDIISLDVSGIKSMYVEDPTLARYAQGVNARQMLEGARNVEFKFGTTLYGLGVVPAVDAQAEANPMTDIIEDAMGGAHYSNTTTITGGTAIAPIFDEIDNIEVGQLIEFRDNTTPA